MNDLRWVWLTAIVVLIWLQFALPESAFEGECESCGRTVGPTKNHAEDCPYD